MGGLALAEGMTAAETIGAECLGVQAPGGGGTMRSVPSADIFPLMGLEAYYPAQLATQTVCGPDSAAGMSAKVDVAQSPHDEHPEIVTARAGAQGHGISGASVTHEAPTVQVTTNAADKSGPEVSRH